MRYYTWYSVRCFLSLVAQCLIVASCAPLSSVPWEAGLRDTSEDKNDLLHQSRKWVTEYGRAEAADLLEEALADQDESQGLMESRMLATNNEKSLVYPNSLHTIPMEDRKRVAIYFVLGLRQDRGRAAPIIKRAVEHMQQRGFRAQFIDVVPRKTAQEHALLVAESLKEDLPHVDKAVLIGFSRGSADLVHFWLGPSRIIPESDLAKIKVWVNFTGVIRGSAVARWMAVGKEPTAWVFRWCLNMLNMTPRSSMIDLASIGYDRWAAPGNKLPGSVRQHLNVINFVSIPDGTNGWPSKDPYKSILAVNATKHGPVLGPCDGLVESAATVLPPNTEIKQWIVRVKGSHIILSGKYLNGNMVASKYHQGRKARLESGSQLMDDFLRAMPRSLLK